MTGCFFRKFKLTPAYAAFAFHLSSLALGTVMPLISLVVFLEMLCQFSPAGLFHALYYGAVLGIIGALIPAMIYAKRVSFLDAVWAPVYTIYSLFLLWWIPIYALFTARNSNWLTRELAPLPQKAGKCTNNCKQERLHN
jgi:hypothetical protein